MKIEVKDSNGALVNKIPSSMILSDDYTLKIDPKLSENSDFEDFSISISPSNPSLSNYPISSLDDNLLKFGAECPTCATLPPKYPLTLTFSYYSNLISDAIEILRVAIPFISGGAIAAVGLASSINISIELIKCFQILDTITFLNVNTPLNVLYFTRIFSVDIFDIFPNFMKFDESGLDCKNHEIIEDNGLECLGVNNIGNLLLVIGIFGILKFLIFLINQILGFTVRSFTPSL